MDGISENGAEKDDENGEKVPHDEATVISTNNTCNTQEAGNINASQKKDSTKRGRKKQTEAGKNIKLMDNFIIFEKKGVTTRNAASIALGKQPENVHQSVKPFLPVKQLERSPIKKVECKVNKKTTESVILPIINNQSTETSQIKKTSESENKSMSSLEDALPPPEPMTVTPPDAETVPANLNLSINFRNETMKNNFSIPDKKNMSSIPDPTAEHKTAVSTTEERYGDETHILLLTQVIKDMKKMQKQLTEHIVILQVQIYEQRQSFEEEIKGVKMEVRRAGLEIEDLKL